MSRSHPIVPPPGRKPPAPKRAEPSPFARPPQHVVTPAELVLVSRAGDLGEHVADSLVGTLSRERPRPDAPLPPGVRGLDRSERAELARVLHEALRDPTRGPRQSVILPPPPTQHVGGPYRSGPQAPRVPTLGDVVRVLVAFVLRRPVR
jgi:hypothetical protein